MDKINLDTAAPAEIENIDTDPHRAEVSGMCGEREITTHLRIPIGFETATVALVLIAYCKSGHFLNHSPTTRYNAAGAIKLFLLFISDKYDSAESLPDTLLLQYIHYLNIKKKSVNAIDGMRSLIIKALKWAGNTKQNGSFNHSLGHRVGVYTSISNCPKLKIEKRIPKKPLSALFDFNYSTNEILECPYSDSELILSLRWLAVWYLDVADKRRKFLQRCDFYEEIRSEIKKNGVDTAPFENFYVKEWYKSSDYCPQKFEWARRMYSEMIKAILDCDEPDKEVWLEELYFSMKNNKSELLNSAFDYPFGSTEIAGYLSRLFGEDGLLKENWGGKKLDAFPSISLRDIILPTVAETQMMCWLLASERIQKSGISAQTLEMFEFSKGMLGIRFFKGRSPTEGFKTETYRKTDPIYKPYADFYHTMIGAQDYIKQNSKRKGRLIHSMPDIINMLTKAIQLSLIGIKGSAHNYHAHKWLLGASDINEHQNSFFWILDKYISHQVTLRKQDLKLTNERNKRLNQGKSTTGLRAKMISMPVISIGYDNIGRSRHVFEENTSIDSIADKKRKAQQTAHSEGMFDRYKDRTNAKETLKNAAIFGAQVGEKMVEDALKFLDNAHIVSITDVKIELGFASPSEISSAEGNDDFFNFINQVAKNGDVDLFGGININSEQQSKTLIIDDEKSALLMLKYIQHIESEWKSIIQNHPDQIVKWSIKHAQLSLLFERFSSKSQAQAKSLATRFKIPFPPII